MTPGTGGSSATRAAGSPRVAAAALQSIAGWAGSWAFPFLLVLYLALSGGGYDIVVRGEVAIVIWWVLLLAAAAGALPLRRSANAATIASVALLLGFTAWTAAGLLWTESFESTITEVGRVASLAGIFIFAAYLQDRHGLRRTTGAVATAIAIVAGLAVLCGSNPRGFRTLTRQRPCQVWPTGFPPIRSTTGTVSPPLMAMGGPLLLIASVSARALTIRGSRQLPYPFSRSLPS